MARRVPNRGSRPRQGIRFEFNSLGAVRKEFEDGDPGKKSKWLAICRYVGSLPNGSRSIYEGTAEVFSNRFSFDRSPGEANPLQLEPDVYHGSNGFLEKKRMMRTLASTHLSGAGRDN